MLSTTAQDHINQTIWRQYPEFQGVKPSVRAATQSGSSGAAGKFGGLKLQEPAFTLTYQSKVSLPGGKSLSRWVRVSLNAQGEILKISSSK